MGMWRIAFKHYTIFCICSFFLCPHLVAILILYVCFGKVRYRTSIGWTTGRFFLFFVVKAIQTFSLDQIGRVFLCCPLKKCIIVFVNFNSPFDLLTVGRRLSFHRKTKAKKNRWKTEGNALCFWFPKRGKNKRTEATAAGVQLVFFPVLWKEPE